MAIQFKRGSSVNRAESEDVLKAGQPFYEKDTKRLYVGDGATKLKDLTTIDANLNIENGTGVKSIQQKFDPKYNGVVKAASKNPYAKVLYPELTDSEPLGTIGDYSASFGGNSSVQAKRGIGGGTSSVTKGPYSQSLGDNTVTTPKASDSTAIGYQTTTDAPGAFTHGSYTVVMSQKYIEGMFDPSVEPGQGGSGQPTEPGTTPADTLEMDNRRGEAASAGGFNSYSSGFAAEVDGVSNVADGHISKSSGRSNRSWSYLSKTDGKNSVVKPDQTNENATGEGSWANGDNIQIIGAKYAYSGGSNNIVFAGADNSFSYGEGLQVKHKNQVVLGQYNDSNNNDLFVFGVGTGNSNRKNALRISKEGKFYYGDFEVSNLKTTNDAVASLDNKLSPKITGNTTEITNLWKTLRDTNTNLNNLNEHKYDKTGGTIGGDVIITGDLTVNGTQHINNTENLNVENAMIYSNAAGATLATNGGIGIKKNATDVYGIVYDPISDSVKLGLGKSDANGVFTFNANEGQPVVIRDDSAKLVNNNLVKWDGTNHKLIDAGKNVDNLIDKLPASLINQAYVRNANGEDTGLAYTYTDEGNTLALRNASGQVQVSTPLQDNDAANKKFVEDTIATLNIQNGTGNKSLQQVIDSDFTLVNINSDRTDQTIQSGAVGVFAAAFGGKSRSEGKRAFSAGTQTIATGNYSAAFGNNSISEGVNSFVEGSQNISRGNSSHAENANNLAAADNTHVEGVENTATHMGAHVQGYKNGSFGDYTHTEGGENVSSTTANVTYSHIGGYKNTMVITGTANPDASEGGSTPGGGESTSKPTEFWATFIDGAWNKASGTNSFTIGYWNQNYGNGTFIAGHNNIIYNNVETAMLFGRQLQCGRNCQVVFGENNLLNKDALLIVGNGTGVTGPNRFSNAFEVLKDGRVKVQAAPKEDNDVVRTLELNNVNARYVSTSILGG